MKILRTYFITLIRKPNFLQPLKVPSPFPDSIKERESEVPVIIILQDIWGEELGPFKVVNWPRELLARAFGIHCNYVASLQWKSSNLQILG